MTATNQGFADETLVAVKSEADEDAVTYLRVKLLERDRMSKAKGGMCEQRDGTQTVTVVLRPAMDLPKKEPLRTSGPLCREGR